MWGGTPPPFRRHLSGCCKSGLRDSRKSSPPRRISIAASIVNTRLCLLKIVSRYAPLLGQFIAENTMKSRCLFRISLYKHRRFTTCLCLKIDHTMESFTLRQILAERF